jgi:hypothetical protein
MARIKPEKWEDPFAYNTTDEKGNVIQVKATLAEAEVQELLDLQEFIRNNKNNAFIIWTTVTADEFEEFRDDLMDDSVANKAQAAALAAAAVTTQVATTVRNTTATTVQAAGAYKMRRLYTDFKDITKRHFFTQWLKEVKVTAHTQQCSNPLNPAYKPGSPDKMMVFDMDNAYIFNVAAKTIKYPLGKTIIQRHLDDMDGQKTFMELTADATGEIVSKINETKLEDTLRKMDASPDSWHGGGESFLDAFETNLVQLNDSRDTPVDEKQVRDWLCYCLRGHPAAVVSINQQRELEIFQCETTPGYLRPFSNFMNGLRISLQQYDDEHKPKQGNNQKGRVNDNVDRRANVVQQSPEDFERFRSEMKELGMWLEVDAYKAMTPQQQRAHKEKIKIIRQQRRNTQANVGQTIPTDPAPAIATPNLTTAPQTFAQAATQSASNEPGFAPAVIISNGRHCRLATAQRTYQATAYTQPKGSLVDSGCNGGLAGEDVLILDCHSFGKVDIVGVGENLIPGIPLCTATGLIQTTSGPIIGIMHNYAALGKGGSIHSPVQMKDFGIIIDDTPRTQKRFDGEQGTQTVRIPTVNEGQFFDVDLHINSGLAYFHMQPPTREQLNDESIPHVMLTSDMEWDPAKYDDQQDTAITPEEYHPARINTLDIGNEDGSMVILALMDNLSVFESDEDTDEINDEFIEIEQDDPGDSIVEQLPGMTDPFAFVPNVVAAVACFNRTIEAKLPHVEHKYGKSMEQLRPNFAWALVESIKATLDASTQFYWPPNGLRKSKGTSNPDSLVRTSSESTRPSAQIPPLWKRQGAQMALQDTVDLLVSNCSSEMRPNTSRYIQYRQMETTPRCLGTTFELMGHQRSSSVTTQRPKRRPRQRRFIRTLGFLMVAQNPTTKTRTLRSERSKM